MKLPGHLISYGEWREWVDYEEYIFEDERSIDISNGYQETPSKDACDKLSAEKSGEVIRYFV